MLNISLLDGTLLSGCLMCPPIVASYAGVVDSDGLVDLLSSYPLNC